MKPITKIGMYIGAASALYYHKELTDIYNAITSPVSPQDRKAIQKKPSLDQRWKSPNYNTRPNDVKSPSYIMLHYTATTNFDDAIKIFTNKKTGVSAHYLITHYGTICKLVPENSRAWHAGAGKYKGITDMNDVSIGIEIENAGPGEKYTEAQILSVITMCADIMRRYKIPASHIIGHSDYAPGRKEDPGPHFPWKRVRAALRLVEKEF